MHLGIEAARINAAPDVSVTGVTSSALAGVAGLLSKCVPNDDVYSPCSVGFASLGTWLARVAISWESMLFTGARWICSACTFTRLIGTH